MNALRPTPDCPDKGYYIYFTPFKPHRKRFKTSPHQKEPMMPVRRGGCGIRK